ncbi:MAG: RnfABCDGE type electron transport complex subunit G [Synergistaceae bacterium]|nr:RnfABCDGE type electron transport complex subunit G [Synergistaceae bacterium]
MSKIVKLGLILFAITAVTGLILGAVHTMTLEPIREAQAREKNEALASTLPGAQNFRQLEIDGEGGGISEVYEGEGGGSVIGYNFTVTPKGYGGLITLVVGVNNDGRVMDIKILNHSETPGLGAKAGEPAFAGQFREKLADELAVTKTPPESENQIQAISGATITSTAVTDGVNAALKYWRDRLKDGAAGNKNSEEAY